MKKVNIKQLGRDFKVSKSEKTFKQLFDACKPGVVAYYSKFGNTIEILEDCYNETMISIWNDIDKIEVEKYSISTMIFLKTKQNILRHYKSVGGQFNSCDIDDPTISNVVLAEDVNTGDYTGDIQEEYIRDENINTLWNNIKTVLNNEISFDILYDKYAKNMKTTELSEKYDINSQNVLNRIFNAKKKLKTNEQIYYEFIG
tara:strand:- start:3498 stop:4100 length:603 start_codon:yes stop_codon:yes gene_type:complete